MPPRKAGSNQSLTSQISELTRKIALLDGDRKAYYESAEWTIKKNKEKIAQLRKDARELHKDAAEADQGDERILDEAFENRFEDRAAMKGKTSREAIVIMNDKVCDDIKKLNALKNQSEKKEKETAEKRKQLEEMEEAEKEVKDTDAGKNEMGQKKRQLENRLDKAQLKTQEAERLNRTYEKILHSLKTDQKTHHNRLDDMEQEIQELEEELNNLKTMSNDAQISRDIARQELTRQETLVYEGRRDREAHLKNLRQQLEERKLHERSERRLQRASVAADDSGSASGDGRVIGYSYETEKKIQSFEEAFIVIKQATGVSDTQEVVLRFENQEDTQQHLEELKFENEKRTVRLREDKDRMQTEFEEMKYTGEVKMSRGQQMLEEFQEHLEKEELRRDDLEDEFTDKSSILVDVKAGVDHLDHKLGHLKGAKGDQPPTQAPKDSDEYVLDLLMICEDKLLKLDEELEPENVEELREQMEQDEYIASLEERQPRYNVRVKLPVKAVDKPYDDEDDSGDDDDVLSRDDIKRQGQMLVDSKTNRKMTKRKKKGK